MRRNVYLGTFGKNLTTPFASATSISYKTDAFRLSGDAYAIYSMFLCIHVAWPCDLVLWSFDPDIVSYMPDPYNNYDNPTVIGYRVMNYSLRVTTHAPCHVTYHHCHYWYPWLLFSYLLCHCRGVRPKIQPCYRRKIAFIQFWRPRSSLRMRGLHNWMLTPNCLFTIKLSWGYDDNCG